MDLFAEIGRLNTSYLMLARQAHADDPSAAQIMLGVPADVANSLSVMTTDDVNRLSDHLRTLVFTPRFSIDYLTQLTSARDRCLAGDRAALFALNGLPK